MRDLSLDRAAGRWSIRGLQTRSWPELGSHFFSFFFHLRGNIKLCATSVSAPAEIYPHRMTGGRDCGRSYVKPPLPGYAHPLPPFGHPLPLQRERAGVRASDPHPACGRPLPLAWERWFDFRPYVFQNSRPSWGHSSAGRAPAWHAGGRRFDPVWLHHDVPIV